MKRFASRLLVVVLCVACFVVPFASAQEQLKALIVSGQNNHNWKLSTPMFKTILEDSDIFVVDVAYSPENGQDMSGFKPDFAAYDVIVSDYNGDRWSAETDKAFIDYMKNGGGLVVIHAADNAFGGWDEYNKMIGLRWGGDENLGPYIRWREGKFVRDMTPGGAGGHGNQHEFQVINRDTEHPITKGLPEKWMHAKDELYSSLRGPAENMTVLSTAFASPDSNGSGEHEPVLWTVDYGKGRVFHTILAHVGESKAPAVESVGFAVTFQRGTEWAATGKVTQEVPIDFPDATTVRLRPDYKKVRVENLVNQMKDYNYGGSLDNYLKLVEYTNNVFDDKVETAKIEKLCIDFLDSDASLAAKQVVGKHLSTIASDASVDVAASLLDNAETADLGLFILERLESGKADEALCGKLATAKGNVKIGIINSLGVRGDADAVKSLVKLAGDSDEAVANAAINSLGKIAGKSATKALGKIVKRSTGQKQMIAYDAYLKSANAMAENGDKRGAYKVYTKLYKSEAPQIIRIAALKSRIVSADDKAGDVILESLKENDPQMQAVAFGFVGEVKKSSDVKMLGKELSKLSGLGQLQLLTALAERGDPVVIKDVTALISSSDKDVRIAAYKAIGKLGDSNSVMTLAEVAASTSLSNEERNAARQSLYRLVGSDVDAEILKQIPVAKTPVKIELISSVGNRMMKTAVPTLLKAAKDSDGGVRTASYKVMKVVAEEKDVASLIALLDGAKTAKERKALVSAITAGSRKSADKEHADKVILAKIDTVKSVESKCALLTVLGRLGNDSSLGELRKALKSDNNAVKDAAIKAMARWSNPAPMNDMIEVVKDDKSTDTQKVLAMRSYVKLVTMASERQPAETVKLLAEGMAYAKGSQEKIQLLGALSEAKCPEALELAKASLGDPALAKAAQQIVDKLSMATVSVMPNEEKGIKAVKVDDGKFAVKKDDEGDGTVCLTFGGFLYLRVQDEFSKDVHDNRKEIQVEVTFKDSGRGNIALQYDSFDDGAPLNGAYKTAGKTVSLNDSGKWRTETWILNDARLSKRENAGSDMRLQFGGGTLWVSKIEMYKKR